MISLRNLKSNIKKVMKKEDISDFKNENKEERFDDYRREKREK